MTFCTLFDSYYLDKGIALYRSLERTAGDQFKLYIFCFDEKSYEVLEAMKLEKAILIKSSVFDNDILLRLKEERSKAEYCWTCTPQTIEYVLDHYNEESVTYIDADIYFFSSPQPLFDEIKKAEANVVITEHRFADSIHGRRMLRRSGKYCVEFNYFDQSENSRECLSWWKEKCIEWCYHIYEPERMGDQKYLEKFPMLFKGVHELQHVGGGVAPWNLEQYSLIRNDKIAGIKLGNKSSHEEFDLIFYHFQNIRYLSSDCINVYSGTHDKELKDAIYLPYLREIQTIRGLLRHFQVEFPVRKKYSSRKLVALMQATVLRYKIKSLSDIYYLKRL